MYLVVGWTRELGYSPEEIEASGFVGDNDDYLAYKIGYFNYKPGIRYLLQDFDDFRMPYNLKDDKSHGIYAGDVWATDSYLPNEPAAWSRIADELTKDAQGIWDTWGENGELDLMESKKSESAKGSMRRKQESLKNEAYPDFATKEDLIRAFTNMKEAWACIADACHDSRFVDKYGVEDWFNAASEYNPKLVDDYLDCFSLSFDELQMRDFCDGMIAYLNTLQEAK